MGLVYMGLVYTRGLEPLLVSEMGTKSTVTLVEVVQIEVYN